MAWLVEVDSARDDRLADYVQLRDVTLRRRLESEHGLFIAEGAKVLRRAVAAGYQVRSLLMSFRWLEELADVLEQVDAPCYVTSETVVEQVTGFHVHRGALASLHRLPLPSVAEVVDGARRLVVLEDLVDHANVGAIVRTAAAMDFDAVLLSPRCADPLYRRAVKVAMGAVFLIPYARLEPWHTGIAELRSRGFRTIALTPAPDAVSLEDLVPRPEDRFALVFGAEGDGLSARWQTEADLRVRIPIRAGMDSLNVAAAAAVACWALRARS